MLSRRAGWSPVVAGPLLLAGLVLARVLVPDVNDTVLRVVEYFALGVEGLVLASVIAKARSLRQGYREQRRSQVYGFDTLQQAGRGGR